MEQTRSKLLATIPLGRDLLSPLQGRWSPKQRARSGIDIRALFVTSYCSPGFVQK